MRLLFFLSVTIIPRDMHFSRYVNIENRAICIKRKQNKNSVFVKIEFKTGASQIFSNGDHILKEMFSYNHDDVR